MLFLLNSTKTMDLSTQVPTGIATADPAFLTTARKLAAAVSKLTPEQLARLMSLSDTLAAQTHDKFSLWGMPGQPTVPALFGFTGLIFKHLDAPGFNQRQLHFAGKHIRILSGLYGLLEPFDRIEAYRLEMGCKLAVDGCSNLSRFWKEGLTSRLNRSLGSGEPVISVASQEYMKALDIKKLARPVIMPVFKERRPDGSYKNAVVHAKKARGAMVRYAIEKRAKNPTDLTGFSEMGWTAAGPPPDAGSWLFTRPVE